MAICDCKKNIADLSDVFVDHVSSFLRLDCLMSRIVRWIAKYGILIGFLAAALGLIFGVRYFFERDLSAALGGAAGSHFTVIGGS